MPTAHGAPIAQIINFLQDHETEEQVKTPPTINVWYTLLDDDDVKLNWFAIIQANDEHSSLDVEIKVTIDGNVYLGAFSADDGTMYYLFKSNVLAAAPNTIDKSTDFSEANGQATPKYGLHMKIEYRVVSAVGTNQALSAWADYETLEAT
jgi:hypothetical protein